MNLRPFPPLPFLVLAALCFLLAPAPAAFALTLEPGRFDVESDAATPAVEAALADLRRDFKTVLGSGPSSTAPALIRISIDRTLPPETFMLEVADRVQIRGGDELGAIYGIYEFSRRFLGVDPFWFWKDLSPAQKTSLELAPQHIDSGKPVFRYRGWFLNDEDLLGGWKPSGERFRDWPARSEFAGKSIANESAAYETRLLRYYTPVAGPDIMQMVFEALLRQRGNLIIPASFIDIMNAPEAAIIRAAVQRGLYISQHHVEPLGVSFFAYETWWSKQKKGAALPEFSYRTEPDALRAAWTAYAKRWHEIAGDHLIWQLGLRGRGDRPLWDKDPKAKALAGELISGALRDEWAIIRSVDPRPAPPATLTLWAEGADLLAAGKLTLPAGVTCVFSDDAVTQTMQKDFLTLPREPGRPCGYYYHVTVWPNGPHLVQGLRPSAIADVAGQVAAKGDTAYAILNVSNLREHLMGASAWLEQTWNPTKQTDAEFLKRWSPAGLAPLHAELLDCMQLSPDIRLYDGGARQAVYRLIRSLETGTGKQKEAINRKTLAAATERLDALIEKLNRQTVAPELRSFFDTNLRAQAVILRGLYGSLAALQETPANLDKAAQGLDSALAGYSLGGAGNWQGWYRGDTKMGLALLRDRVLALKKPR